MARFRGRNWEYDHTHTTCTLCPVGCSITVDARNGSLERIVAGENREVNEAWICDAGRFGHVFASENRLTAPMIRNEDGELVTATWDQAVDAIRAGMAGLDAHDLALFLNADSTLEEGVAAEAFAGLTGLASVDHWPRQPGYGNDAPTLTEIAQSDGVVVLGADLGEEAPIVELRILEMLRGGILPAEFNHGTAIADLRLVERPGRQPHKLAVLASTESRLMEHAGFAAQVDAATALAGLTGSSDNAAVSAAAELLNKARAPDSDSGRRSAGESQRRGPECVARAGPAHQNEDTGPSRRGQLTRSGGAESGAAFGWPALRPTLSSKGGSGQPP